MISLNMFFYIKKKGKRTRAYIQNLRHMSLGGNVSNTHATFQVWNLHTKREKNKS